MREPKPALVGALANGDEPVDETRTSQAQAAVAVDRRTGELVSVCTTDEARVLTDRIKASAETLWGLLVEAQQRKAWKALGYPSWREYACAEFGVGQSHAYRLLDQAHVIREIESAAGISPVGEISERETRDIKPILPEVTEAVRERVAAMADPEPEQVREAVRDVIESKRPAPQPGTRTYARSPASRSLPAALASLGGIAMAFRQVRDTDLNDITPEDAATWAKDLTDVIAALRSLRDLLKEHA